MPAFPSLPGAPAWFLAAFTAGFGALVGSFLNVVILRLPERRSIVFPGSHCPKCQAPIRWYDNVPVVSWVVLRGRCRACKEKISARYPLVEGITSLLFVAVVWRFGLETWTAVYLLFGALMVVLTFIDLDHRIIPNRISVPGIVIGLVVSFFLRRPHDAPWWAPILPTSWQSSLVAILVGGGALFLIAEVYRLVRHDEGMGMGDVKMIAMIGAFLGVASIPFVFVVSSLVGSLIGITLMALFGGNLKTAVPFGPFLALGSVLYLFVGPELVTAYLAHTAFAGGALPH